MDNTTTITELHQQITDLETRLHTLHTEQLHPNDPRLTDLWATIHRHARIHGVLREYDTITTELGVNQIESPWTIAQTILVTVHIDLTSTPADLSEKAADATTPATVAAALTTGRHENFRIVQTAPRNT